MGIKKWILPQQSPETVNSLSEKTRLSPLVCSILSNRGCQTSEGIQQMITAVSQPLADPYTLIDMDKAVARIRQALEQGERIAVYGDYDCDGITATVLMISYLQSVGADCFYYIPSREKEGYGMNKGAVDFIRQQGVTLIITVDNGISAHEEIDYANDLGIDTVITDHHTPRDTLPQATAVLNPHRTDCPSEYKHLAGVGVAFKLICALEEDDGSELLEYYSDVVMLGTIADVMPLTGENRIIVSHGLNLLTENQRPGVSALIEVSGLAENSKIGSEAIAFTLIPRLNAAGRMDCVDDAVELLLTDDVPYDKELAQTIDGHNVQRKQIENDILTQIEGILAKNPQILSERILIVSGENWHHGVVGIVAAKLLEKYGKPTILFSIDGAVARGSGRSIEGFSLIEAITACSEYLTQYGGHTLAAGLTVPKEHLQQFQNSMQQYAAEKFPAMPVPLLEIDCIMRHEYFNIDCIKQLSLLEPFGQGNRQPSFLMENCLIEGIYPTNDKKHVRIRMKSGESSFYAIYFRMTEEQLPYKPGDKVDLIADVTAGEYNGKPQLSVKIKDLRLSGIPQEQILQERIWYSSFKEGQLTEFPQEIVPTRDNLAVVYKYLRTCGKFTYGADELYCRIYSSGISYMKMRIALDVFEEMGLLSRSSQNEEAVLQLLPAKEKVDMEQSKILISLRV